MLLSTWRQIWLKYPNTYIHDNSSKETRVQENPRHGIKLQIFQNKRFKIENKGFHFEDWTEKDVYLSKIW